jgi:tetratricopeptide (TPR) repeat protein
MGSLTLGELALATGDLPGAARRFDEGLTLAQRTGDLRFKAYLLAAQGSLATAEGRAGDARRKHGEALQIRTRLGSHTELAESRLALARVGLLDNRVDTQTDVKSAIGIFAERRLAAAECYGWAVVAAASLAANQLKEAGDAATRAEQLLPSVQTMSRRFWIAIQVSRVRAALGNRERAMASLRTTVAQARTRGFVLLEREAQRALTDVEPGLKAPAPHTGGS